MTRNEIDILWHQAMQQAVTDGEMFTRYHFAALIAAAEREACAELCEALNSESDYIYVDECAAAIRSRSQASTARMCPSTYYECSRGCGDGGCKDFSDAHGIGESRHD